MPVAVRHQVKQTSIVVQFGIQVNHHHERSSRKGAKTQRKHAKLLNAACSLRPLLCAFAPLRETAFLFADV
jgi:hypothetical protein